MADDPASSVPIRSPTARPATEQRGLFLPEELSAEGGVDVDGYAAHPAPT
jgi:hypothetical protein